MKTLGLTIAAAAITFTGCAATTSPSGTANAKKMTADSSFPTRISEDGLGDALSDYDQLISRRYNGSVKTRVNVCVKPSGQVSKASVVRGSGIAGFDRAVAKAAAGWKYQNATAGNDTTRCKNVSVVYQSQI